MLLVREYHHRTSTPWLTGRAVEEILSRTSHETLMKIYNLPQIGPPLEFLTMLALVSGKLLKVRPDGDQSPRTRLNDLTSGRYS